MANEILDQGVTVRTIIDSALLDLWYADLWSVDLNREDIVDGYIKRAFAKLHMLHTEVAGMGAPIVVYQYKSVKVDVSEFWHDFLEIRAGEFQHPKDKGGLT